MSCLHNWLEGDVTDICHTCGAERDSRTGKIIRLGSFDDEDEDSE